MTRYKTRIAKFFDIETKEIRHGRLSRERGMRAEERAADALKEGGCLVKRSPGSRGPYDLEAFRGGTRFFAQVKSGDAWPSTDEVKSLAKVAARRGAYAGIIHEHRGLITPYPVCRWCGKVGEPEDQDRCEYCGQPF